MSLLFCCLFSAVRALCDLLWFYDHIVITLTSLNDFFYSSQRRTKVHHHTYVKCTLDEFDLLMCSSEDRNMNDSVTKMTKGE